MTRASLSCPICRRMRGDSGRANSPTTANGVGMAQTIKNMCQALKCSWPSSTTIKPRIYKYMQLRQCTTRVFWNMVQVTAFYTFFSILVQFPSRYSVLPLVCNQHLLFRSLAIVLRDCVYISFELHTLISQQHPCWKSPISCEFLTASSIHIIPSSCICFILIAANPLSSNIDNPSSRVELVYIFLISNNSGSLP